MDWSLDPSNPQLTFEYHSVKVEPSAGPGTTVNTFPTGGQQTTHADGLRCTDTAISRWQLFVNNLGTMAHQWAQIEPIISSQVVAESPYKHPNQVKVHLDRASWYLTQSGSTLDQNATTYSRIKALGHIYAAQTKATSYNPALLKYGQLKTCSDISKYVGQLGMMEEALLCDRPDLQYVALTSTGSATMAETMSLGSPIYFPNEALVPLSGWNTSASGGPAYSSSRMAPPCQDGIATGGPYTVYQAPCPSISEEPCGENGIPSHFGNEQGCYQHFR